MSYWGGLASGFSGASDQARQETLAKEESNRKLETGVFQTLLGSSDPDIRATALTGLFNSVNPKSKGGLRGWLGETQQNPAFADIRRLMGTPVESQETIPGPHELQMSAAMPSTALTSPGAPPPQRTMTTWKGTAPAAPAMPAEQPLSSLAMQPTGRPSESLTSTVSHPRQLFRSPEEELAATEGAKADTIFRTILGHGGTQDEALEAYMASKGQPRRADSFSGGPAMRLPDGLVVETTRNNRTGAMTVVGSGQPVPPGSSPMPKNEGGGAIWTRVPDRGQYPTKSATGWWRVHRDAAGNEIGHGEDEYVPPNPYQQGPNAPGQVPTVFDPHTGGYRPAAGGVPTPGEVTNPTTYQAQKDLEELEKEAMATARVGGMVLPSRLATQREAIAKRMGYPSYDVLRQAGTQPVKQPVSPSQSAPSSSPFDPAAIQRRIEQNRQATPPKRP